MARDGLLFGNVCSSVEFCKCDDGFSRLSFACQKCDVNESWFLKWELPSVMDRQTQKDLFRVFQKDLTSTAARHFSVVLKFEGITMVSSGSRLIVGPALRAAVNLNSSKLPADLAKSSAAYLSSAPSGGVVKLPDLPYDYAALERKSRGFAACWFFVFRKHIRCYYYRCCNRSCRDYRLSERKF